MSLHRSTAETVGASTPSKSTVATTWLRIAGSATNGAAKGEASAQPKMVAADLSQREAAHSSPPLLLIHSTCCAARKTVARAGVLYVWSRRELSRAVLRSSDVGIHRSLAAIRSIRSIARGEHTASQRPPSLARHFWGAK